MTFPNDMLHLLLRLRQIEEEPERRAGLPECQRQGWNYWHRVVVAIAEDLKCAADQDAIFRIELVLKLAVEQGKLVARDSRAPHLPVADPAKPQRDFIVEIAKARRHFSDCATDSRNSSEHAGAPPVVAKDPDVLMKKKALIQKLRPEWHRIESHLDEAHRNGLAEEARTSRGYYSESKAKAWATRNGHIASRQSPSLLSVTHRCS